MASKFVGIDLGSRSVKLVVLTSGVRGIRFFDQMEVPMDLADEGRDRLEVGMHTAIAALRERGWAHLPVGVALPGTATSFRVVKFPFSEPKRVGQVINFEIEGQFPTAIEDLQFDHLVTRSSAGGCAALVTAARRDRVDAVSDGFNESGVDLRVVTSGPVAMAQVLGGGILPIEAGPNQEPRRPVSLLVDIGHRETGIVALSDKGPVAARALRRGGFDQTLALREAYGLGVDEADDAKHRDGFVSHRGLTTLTPEQRASGDLIARSLERTVRELEHTRRWLDSELRCEVTELRLVGGGSLLAGLAAFLGEQTGLPCRPFAGQARAVVARVPVQTWAKHAVALGTAYAVAKRPWAQLYDQSERGGEGGWVQEKMGAVAAIGIAITAFAAVDTIVKLKGLEAEQANYEAELEQASTRVFGEPVYTASAAEERLKAVEGTDLISTLPPRGALDVLAMIGKVAQPVGPPSDAPVQSPVPSASSASSALSGGFAGAPGEAPFGARKVSGVVGAAGVLELAPVAADAGIVADDELIISRIDIRELVVEMQLSATRATAQDRLKLKLTDLDCVTEVLPGKIRDQNSRKVFPIKVDHRCFRAGKDE
ncbi:MAG: pilus assembly protein PilM [Nannocystaceae bacterium]